MIEVLAKLWADRWIILLLSAAFFLAGLSYVLWGPRWYEAKVVLVPSASAGGGLPAGLGQFSGLASLAGISLPGDTESQVPMAVLNSREFARQFIEDNDLLTQLFSSRWDPTAKKWKESRFRETPDTHDAVDVFLTRVRGISEDKRTGIVSLTMTWKDPESAARWANGYVERLNEWLREDASVRARENIRFLQEEMVKSTIPAMQQPLGHVIESEMQKLLLAQGNREFAFRVVDPAVKPRKPVTPALAVLVLSLLAGGVIGGAVSIAKWVVRDIRRSSATLSA